MGTSSSDILQLVWDNHLANISALFESLYREHKLVDVTLACRDGHLRAHKLVLSACSPFFERIFQENPCDHPVVIVRGVYYQEMQTLLDYIYKGRISIAANLVNDLVCVASDLEIKGFESFREISGMNSRDERGQGMKGCYQKQKPCPSSFVTTVMPTKAQKKLNYDQLSLLKTAIDNDQQSCSDNDDGTSIAPSLPELVCAVCYYKTRSHNDLLQHWLLHEQLERQHMCEYCPASFARSSHLARHRRSHTGERPFTCYCGKNFARQDKLKSHIRKNHSSGAAGSASGSQMSQTLFMSNGLQLMATNQPKPDTQMLPKPQIKTEQLSLEPLAKRRRGRPRKEEKPKRGRGRPRKKAFPVILQKKDVVDLIPPIPGMKRGRGRPRKIPLVPLYAPDNTTVELPLMTAIKKEPEDHPAVSLFELPLDPQIEVSSPDKQASDVAKLEPFLEYDPLLMVPQSTADYSIITTVTQSVPSGDTMSLTSLTSSS